MALTRDRQLHPQARVTVSGPRKGSVTLTRITNYSDTVTNESQVIRDNKIYDPAADISKLPQEAQDFITAIRTHFNV